MAPWFPAFGSAIAGRSAFRRQFMASFDCLQLAGSGRRDGCSA